MSSSTSTRLVVLFLLTAMVGQVKAEGFWRALKNWVDSADIKGCDTTYLRLPKEGFVGYGNVYLTGSKAYLDYSHIFAQYGTVDVSGTLSTRVASLLSVGVSYRGWGLSYSKDFSKNGDTEWSFCSYGQGYGLETRIHNSYSLSGVLDVEGASIMDKYDIEMKNCHQRLLLGNLYYVFGRKRFSLPAAMSHTIIQKRSSGSWLAILNYRHSATTLAGEHQHYFIGDDILDVGDEGMASYRLSQTQVSLGGGYAYNFIFNDAHCLLHFSAMPMLSIWHRNRRYFDERTWDSTAQRYQDERHVVAISQKLAINGTIHSSFVYNFSRYVTGVMVFANIDSFPEKERFSIYTFDWSSRFFFGVRF
ncbi:MAG: DUF4421 family protein [Bacteroidales bacterium]|nr:DUF4421 family protein [Bacteroidales bacterium]